MAPGDVGLLPGTVTGQHMGLWLMGSGLGGQSQVILGSVTVSHSTRKWTEARRWECVRSFQARAVESSRY